ncbi:MAG: hypothetical protein ACIAS6_01185 [Phycisphaerales bacterium JB060]
MEQNTPLSPVQLRACMERLDAQLDRILAWKRVPIDARHDIKAMAEAAVLLKLRNTSEQLANIESKGLSEAAHSEAPTFTSENEFHAYCVTAVRFALTDYYRRERQRCHHACGGVVDDHRDAAPERPVDAKAISREELSEIDRAIGRLSDSDQVVLHGVIRGISNRAAAEEAGVAESTMCERRWRAKCRLADELMKTGRWTTTRVLREFQATRRNDG